MTISDKIISKVSTYYTYLHEHPELSFEEYHTAAYIRRILKELGILYETIDHTGTIALIPGDPGNRTIALRADIDALPLEESAEHCPISHEQGKMHACGHDLHTACLLGTAEYLCTQDKPLPFNVLLIFQHAEEVLPGGAASVIDSPYFKQYFPDWIIAQHAEPELPLGYAGIHSGQYMASGDEVYIKLRGPGGHAALPDKSVDLVLIASHIVVALQQITSRKASPFIPTVLTFGNIRCNSTMNVIPKEITLEGTFRTFDETRRSEAKARIRQIASGIAKSMGAEAEITIIPGYPSLYNHPQKAAQAIRALESELGKDKVVLLEKRMTTEDFARYSQILPATFIRLGVKGNAPCGKLHTPGFCPDPAALSYGIRTLTSLLFSEL